MDDNAPNLDDSENSDVDELLPSTVSVFSLFRDQIANQYEDSSDVNSSIDSDELPGEEFPDPDEATKTLPCDHQYLGELESIRGREIMDDGSIQKIPLLFPASQVTLVPGQTIPLSESEETAIHVLKYSVEGNHIFGFIPSSYWNPNRSRNDVVGTTAEIIAYGQTGDGYKVKAIGRQRFKVLRVVSELVGNRYITFAYIRILPEITLPPVLHGIRLPSLNKFRSSRRFMCMRREACQTRWPAWIYRYYDEKYLVEEVKRKLTQNFRISENIRFSDDPTTLFFQLLKSVPVSQELMLAAMELNSPIQRLRWFLNILNPKTDKLKCVTCQAIIGYSSDIFAMSAEGPHGTYVNSLGYVHELITLKRVKNVFTSSGPDTNYSWFPGYAWSVLCCKNCQYHIGWKFTACKDQVPNEFWAVKNDSIGIKNDKKRDTSWFRRRLN